MKELGFIFIALGILGGIAVFTTIDFEGYNQAKEIADELWDNEIAQQSFNVQKQLMISQLSQGVTVILYCVTVGVFLLAIDRIVKLLKSIDQSVKQQGVVGNEEQI